MIRRYRLLQCFVIVQKYFELYEKEKERYASEMKEYEATGGSQTLVKKEPTEDVDIDMEAEDE